MKPNLALLKADIRDELDKIARLSQSFREIEPKLNEPPERVPFYDRAALYHQKISCPQQPFGLAMMRS